MKGEEIMRNIILIGMPGCGKSTVGVVLAKNLGYRFIDSDLVIQEKYGRRLCELIDELGEAQFLELENLVNCGIEGDKCVISTGGSAVYGREAMEHFRQIGTVVYLELPYEEIADRLGDLNERGVISNGQTTVEGIYNDRKTLYEKYADVTISAYGKSIPQTIGEIRNKLTNVVD